MVYYRLWYKQGSADGMPWVNEQVKMSIMCAMVLLGACMHACEQMPLTPETLT